MAESMHCCYLQCKTSCNVIPYLFGEAHTWVYGCILDSDVMGKDKNDYISYQHVRTISCISCLQWHPLITAGLPVIYFLIDFIIQRNMSLHINQNVLSGFSLFGSSAALLDHFYSI